MEKEYSPKVSTTTKHPTATAVSSRRPRPQSVSKVIETTRSMLRMKVSMSELEKERLEMERSVREEEERLSKEEEEVRMEEERFDNFLQEWDRKAVEAMREADRATHERQRRMVEVRGITEQTSSVRREVSKVVDDLEEVVELQLFLSALAQPTSRSNTSDKMTNKEKKETEMTKNEQELKTLITQAPNLLPIPEKVLEVLGEEVKVYFEKPEELLELFASLEKENMRLIDQCQRREEQLESDKKELIKNEELLSRQRSEWELEIEALEARIAEERRDLQQLKEQLGDNNDNDDNNKDKDKKSVRLRGRRRRQSWRRGSPRRGSGDERLLKLTKDLDMKLSGLFGECISDIDAATSDKLRMIEAALEALNVQLDALPEDEVRGAKEICERERRRREAEESLARELETRRRRNQRALQRALDPVFVKVHGNNNDKWDDRH